MENGSEANLQIVDGYSHHDGNTHVRTNEFPVFNSQTVAGVFHHDTNNGIRTDEGTINQNGAIPQLLSPASHQHPGTDEASRETLASEPNDTDANPKRSKYNGKEQARHWIFTLNNYTQGDYDRIIAALKTDELSDVKSRKVVSAIVAKEVGETGTPHLQAYVHFKDVKRRTAIAKFLGVTDGHMHLDPHDFKKKPPVAAFRYCMKKTTPKEDIFIVGRNLDEEERLKDKTKGCTRQQGDDYAEMTRKIEEGEITTMQQARHFNAELAANREEYWKSLIIQHIKKTPAKKHDLRPWQIALIEKLQQPFSDREVIFVIDPKGECGKSWFTSYYKETYGKAFCVGADKRDNVSYEILDQLIEYGTPNVIFVDVPRARSMYVSYALLEDLKNGIVRSAKYKSKTGPFDHPPHVVVMMNEYPKKNNTTDLGLSNDRYTYLIIGDPDDPRISWHRGFIDKPPQTPYDTIMTTVQSTLPNELQDAINRAFNSVNVTDPPHERLRQYQTAFSRVVTTWHNKTESRETNADRYVTSINNRATERAMKEYVSNRPIEQYTSSTTGN